MYGFFGEVCRVAYGDLCFLRRHLPETVVSAMVGPLLYLVAFAYGMRSGDSEAGVSYVAYAIPGIVAMTSMTAGFTSTAQKIIIQRLFHTSFDELILSPMHTSSIVFGKAVIGMLRGLIGSAILLVLGLFLTPDLILGPGTVASLLLSCVMFSLLGVAAGLLARSSVSLNVFTSLVIMPMTFLCGTIFSVSALPPVIGDIVWALPLTHSSEVIRASALGWDIPWISVAVMLVYLIVFYAMDYTIIRRKLYRSPKGAVLLHEHILHTWGQSDLGRVDQCECDGDMCIVKSDYGIRTGFRIFDQLTSEGNRRETAACWKSGGTLNPIEGVGSARIRWIWLRPDCLNHRCLAQNTRGHTRKVYRIMCVGRSLECLLICHPKVLHPSRRPIRAMKHRKWGLSPSLYAYL